VSAAGDRPGAQFYHGLAKTHTLSLHHQTDSIEGILHDWGFTEQADLFLLTRNVRDESEVGRAPDVLGPILLL
jgi:hypothetical protein